ncbi:MAG: NADP oxidoreductase [Archangium gephyra]|uniref:NADP oxidoreductase n=1 Tax=Archangium gephyra TaxID=48 RepID=A0A2W5TM91_9BACT|nr:MAG: NADP oxidoreductase [Archangium gephyra]
MRIGVLGTGSVGRAISGKLSSLGHDVRVGSRTAGEGKVVFGEAAKFGELVFNCTSGNGALAALQSCGDALDGKVLLDTSNPLDFSKGFPPSLTVCNTDSLAEVIQRTFPKVRVVKALNTVNHSVMVEPRKLADGEHDLPLCGNDARAKEDVKRLLTSFGWKHFVDLGDLTGARAMEMYLPLWVRLYGGLKTAEFNFKLVK